MKEKYELNWGKIAMKLWKNKKIFRFVTREQQKKNTNNNKSN